MSRIIARTGINRRSALQVMAALGLATPALARGAEATVPRPRSVAGPAGTPSDPTLRQPQVPWQRTLTDEALRTLAALADLILPEDAHSPAASALGAHDFIDEWVSAPYERQQADRQVLLGGLEWLEKTSVRRFGAPFVKLEGQQQTALCDEICDPARAASEHAAGVAFFSLVRNLTAAAVWTTEEGMADLGYVGNIPLAKWELPPDHVLRHLGLKDR